MSVLPKAVVCLATALLVSACGPSSAPRATAVDHLDRMPSLCPRSDYAFVNFPSQWGFCYPRDWRLSEHQVAVTQPPGVATAFDVAQWSTGNFGWLVVTSFPCSNCSVQAWVRQNYDPSGQLQFRPVHWGNAQQAYQLVSKGRWTGFFPYLYIAYANHEIVTIEVNNGSFDLTQAVAGLLSTWRFGR